MVRFLILTGTTRHARAVALGTGRLAELGVLAQRGGALALVLVALAGLRRLGAEALLRGLERGLLWLVCCPAALTGYYLVTSLALLVLRDCATTVAFAPFAPLGFLSPALRCSAGRHALWLVLLSAALARDLRGGPAVRGTVPRATCSATMAPRARAGAN